jgi:monoamine oxidase
VADSFDVIVIGAGPAGLSAAHDLNKAGKRVVVLEARNRIGGRIHTVRERGVVEAGAEFIHGENAVTWQIVREQGLKTHEWGDERSDSYRIFGANGGIRPDTEDFYKRFVKTDDELWAYVKEDISLAEYFRRYATDPEAAEYMQREISDTEVADPEKLSVLGLDNEDTALLSTNLKDHWIVDGYDQIVQALGAGIDVRRLHAVVRVRWKKGQVDVECENGAHFTAKYLVFTIPIGVLKKCPPDFLPALPDTFMDAVRRIGFGSGTKFTVWVDPKVPFFKHLSVKGIVSNFWQRRFGDEPVIVGLTGGPPATELSRMSEAEAIDAGIESLAQGLGSSIKHLVRHARHFTFNNDKYTYGAYTYPALGMGKAREELKVPIDATLYYCGEATNTEGNPGTVHGSIEEGRRVAREVLAG